MNNKQYYQDTFSQVHFSGAVDPESMVRQEKNRRPIGRLVILAAVVCLLAALGITAGAAGILRLQGMVIRQEPADSDAPVESSAQKPSFGENDGALSPVTISLSGFAGSPEKQAVAEWQQFLGSYDADKKILDSIGNSPTGLEEKYGLYYVYTQEMADKLEEITAKYHLKLHSEFFEVPGTWDRAAGGAFLPADITGFYGYMYEDGTFHFDGEWNISDGRSLSFQFGRWVKGSFNEVVLTIGHADDYREWTYMTACGVPVTLAISPHKSLVLTETEDTIITINVLEGSDTGYMGYESGITEEILEAFADSIDFTVLSPVREPVLPLEEPVPQRNPEWMVLETGIPEEEAQIFYCALYRAVEEDRRSDVADMLAYPCRVATSHGEFTIQSPDEFLPYYGDVFHPDVVTAMQHNQYTKERADLFAWDGQVCGAGGEIRFGLVNGILKVHTVHVPATAMGLYLP